MRLICPKCDANYEVDAKVIPDGGRDVQCSACSETWFQPKEEGAANVIQAPEVDVIPTPEPIAEPVASAVAEQPVEPTPPEIVPDTPAQRQKLDKAVIDILRGEATHEEQARAVETSPQDDDDDLISLIKENTTLGSAETLETDANTGPREAGSGTADNNHRADLLPDIDLINSTLHAAPEDGGVMDETVIAPRKSGFRTGFLLMILLMVVATVVYTSAADIIEFWPAGEPYLTTYIAWVDGLRIWVDALMSKAADSLSGIANTASS